MKVKVFCHRLLCIAGIEVKFVSTGILKMKAGGVEVPVAVS